jgi:formamidopyrimidine-DNA glycosylase
VPELPEVETVRRELVPWLTGRRILRARRADAPAGPKYANLEHADGRRIEAVNRRGKFMVLPLSGGSDLIVHLGMTGIISKRDPRTHVRVVVDLGGRSPKRLYFQDVRRFGRFLVVPRDDYRSLPTLHRMGPEPLGDTFTLEAFAGSLAKSRTAIKPYIMSQRPVAGVGNIYVDETLWRSRIHPLTPANKVSRRKIATLRDAIIAVLAASIEAQGTTINDYRTVNGEVGAYLSELDAYGHDGEPCKRCGTLLKKIVVGQRGTHFCPKCQRKP